MTAKQRDETILIVDDEEYNVDYLEQNLVDLGFRTLSAYGGREALERVRDASPDLVLLDVMMPDLDGITVCKMLKSDPKTRLIPIVIMTALDSREDRIRGIEAGADDFLTKPVDEQELIARINTLLRSKQAVAQTVDELHSAASRLEELGEFREDAAIVAVRLLTSEPAADTQPEVRDYVMSRHLETVESVLAGRGAQVIRVELDEVVAAFRSSEDPVMTAIDAARAVCVSLGELDSLGDMVEVMPAIGVSAGDVSVKPERVSEEGQTTWVTEVRGRPVDSATRLASLAAAGSIVASRQALERSGGAFNGNPVELVDEDGIRLEAVEMTGVETPYRDSTSTEEPVRRLETIFVSDIVGSTQVAARLGDERWSSKLDDHYRLVRDVFRRLQGREVSTAGDGFLALFASPANAIRAGHDVSRQSSEIGLPVRVGIHTGEVQEVGDEVQGIAVHMASRVSDAAGIDEVLVTSTTMEAVAGSGLEFEYKGERDLKGIEGKRALYLALP